MERNHFWNQHQGEPSAEQHPIFGTPVNDATFRSERDRIHSYRIAWICALYFEMAVACAILDKRHDPLPFQPSGDTNNYVLGCIGPNNIVIACLPHAQYGTNDAANVVTNMKRTFPSIEISLMVGIGGGIPSRADIRLGDVVVGTKIIQHDRGKTLEQGKAQRTGQPVFPPRSLNTAISTLRAKHEIDFRGMSNILRERIGSLSGYDRPTLPDRLFQENFCHVPGNFSSPCEGCDPFKVVPRDARTSIIPSIHYGGIASGNQVLRDATTRDIIGKELDVYCFEMEAAGFMHVLDCLCIRGISDYSDSHKSKAWQKYAAATAAASTRELLETLPGQNDLFSLRQYQNDIREASDVDHQKSIMKELKFPDMHHRKEAIGAAEEHTCRWLLTNSHYQAWLDTKQVKLCHGFLWINGKPGAGKSVIMKFLALELRKNDQQNNGLTITFFFNARGSILQKSITGMYRSLLYQLFAGYPDLQQAIPSVSFDLKTTDTRLGLNDLKYMFRTAILKLKKRRLTCLIDALDECDEQQALEMVYFFEDLAKSSVQNDIHFRICFSSRPYPHINIPRSIQFTLEDQAGHSSDISNYVTRNLRIEDPTLAEEFRMKIMQKAAGIFLWVVVVISILNKEDRGGRPTIRKQLEEIPNTLSELYEDVLTRDRINMDDLFISMVFILYAKRPLTTREYYHALWCELHRRGQGDYQPPDLLDAFVQKRIRRYITTSSKGLAEINKSEIPTVQFIHESVREFLLKENGLKYIWPNIGPERDIVGHDILKQCCHLYLKLPSTHNALIEGPISSHPFIDYSSNHILYHANEAAATISQHNFLKELNLPVLIHALNALQASTDQWYTLRASLIYILADRGYARLISTWLEIDPRINTYGERYKYPLLAAVINGHKEAVTALMSVISDGPDYQTLTRMVSLAGCIKNSQVTRSVVRQAQEDLPLVWEVLKQGHDALAGFLINMGANIDSKVDSKGTSSPNMMLGLASSRGYVKTARALLDLEVDIDSTTFSWQTPLLEASGNGHEEIVKLLLQNGANIHARDPSGRTAILQAAFGGHHSIVSILIHEGATINDADRLHRTALHLACHRNSKQTVRVLIENNADIDARNLKGQTPMLEAILQGRRGVAELLVQMGGDFTISDHKQNNPLLLATQRGYLQMVRFLIDRGAEINTRDRHGSTPLAWASVLGHEEIVRVLLRGGADVNSVGNNGVSPLVKASRGRYETVAKLLLQNGAEGGDLDL